MTILQFLRREGDALRRLGQRAMHDRDGIAAVEFALILTPMLAMYFGIVQVAHGVMIDRKVTQLNRALADLTSQATTISNTEMANIFAASTMVMEPFTSVAPDMVVASVVVDAAGVAKVCWSDASPPAGALSPGSVLTLPDGLNVPKSSLILARTTYRYTPPIGSAMTGAIDIKSSDIFMRPRRGAFGGVGKIEQVERQSKAMCPT